MRNYFLVRHVPPFIRSAINLKLILFKKRIFRIRRLLIFDLLRTIENYGFLKSELQESEVLLFIKFQLAFVRRIYIILRPFVKYN